MNEQKKRMFWIKFPYWLGIGADAIWAVALFVPPVFSILTCNRGFNPDLQIRLIMGICGSLMTGWTFLLLWAIRKPIEGKFVILLTAFPVVFGMLIMTLIGILEGNTSNLWILIKCLILIISMFTSYILAGKMVKEKK